MINPLATEHIISARLAGMPTVLNGYSKTQRFEPDHVLVRFHRQDDKEWSLAECTISGPHVLKDGRLSVSRRGSAGLLEGWANPHLVENTPEEIRELVGSCRLRLESDIARWEQRS